MIQKAIGVAPVLAVPDVEKTTAYYCNVLGFSLIGVVGEPAAYGMVARDGFHLHFGRSPEGKIHKNDNFRSDLFDVIFWIPEINAYFEEVKSRGAEIVQPIVQRQYGREFRIRDCDGHVILIGD